MPRVRRDGVVHVIAEEKCVKVTKKRQSKLVVMGTRG